MPRPRRLVTVAELDGHANDDRICIRARHELELAGGRRVLLLGDRGWSSSGPPDIWSYVSADEIAATARTVVGPDEPPAGVTAEQEASAHWQSLAQIAAAQDVHVGPHVLRGLPHDVEFGPLLRARLG